MIIWSSDSTKIVLYFKSFSFVGFLSCPRREVENDMQDVNSYTFEACFDTDEGEFGSK